MPPWIRTRAELRTSFQEQFAALQASSRGYDSGDLWEAKRLATTIHILVHDGGKRTVSLLTQLGIRSNLSFLSSRGEWHENNLLPNMPLTVMQFDDQGIAYFPSFGIMQEQHQYLSFSRWWDEEVLRDNRRRVLTRKNLVFSLRDQDGGSHLDGHLTDETYVAFARENAAGWVLVKDGQESTPTVGPHLATMRQIAWEVEQVLSGIDFSV